VPVTEEREDREDSVRPWRSSCVAIGRKVSQPVSAVKQVRPRRAARDKRR